MKCYITFSTDCNYDGEGVYYLITEDGEVLASHFCSHLGFAFGDLTHDRDNEKRISAWKERFGEVDILHLKYCKNPDEIEKQLLEKNEQYYKEHGTDRTPPHPEISIEFSEK